MKAKPKFNVRKSLGRLLEVLSRDIRLESNHPPASFTFPPLLTEEDCKSIINAGLPKEKKVKKG